MLTGQRLNKWVFAEPFQPFRIKMASGEAHEIRHPEMIHVGRSSVMISFFLDDEKSDSQQRDREISLMLMETIEPIDVHVSRS
ncbi:MAG: hypothetical protein K2X38_18260 [Gemmataceae bacterium]|nr:hypothetical protein [Gemmataceae bacterium]